MPEQNLNPDALEAAERWMQEKSATFGLHWKNAKPIIETYLSVAQPVVNSVEELDALPVGSVILTLDQWQVTGQSWQLVSGGKKLWCFAGNTDMLEADKDMVPARVLYRPEAKDD